MQFFLFYSIFLDRNTSLIQATITEKNSNYSFFSVIFPTHSERQYGVLTKNCYLSLDLVLKKSYRRVSKEDIILCWRHQLRTSTLGI